MRQPLWEFSPNGVATDYADLDTGCGKPKKFAPDELLVRRDISATRGHAQVRCIVCGNQVDERFAAFHSDWQSGDTYTCAACRKWGDPHGRLPGGSRGGKHTCEMCGTDSVYPDYLRYYHDTHESVLCRDCAVQLNVLDDCGLVKRGRELSAEWWKVGLKSPELDCDICHEPGPQAQPWEMPGWLRMDKKRQPRRVCRNCAALALEVS